MTAVRVLLVDDQMLFRAGLRTLLATRPEVEVVGDAENGQVALELAARTRPDVVLMDLKMPVLDGVATTRKLRVQVPGCRVVALTTFEDDELVFECLRAGALASRDSSASTFEATDGCSTNSPRDAARIASTRRATGASFRR